MNQNPNSLDFLDIKPWDELTEEQKASGDWTKMEGNEKMAKQIRKTILDSLISKEVHQEDIRQQIFKVQEQINATYGSEDPDGRETK